MRFSVVPLDNSYFEAAFELTTEIFAKNSTLHHALGIQVPEYRNYLAKPFKAMVEEGLSAVAVDQNKNQLIGCMIASDFSRHLNPTIDKTSKFAPLAALTGALCKQYCAHRAISHGEAILVDMAAVKPAATGMGVYQGLREFTHILATKRGYKWVVGELSSISTQHVVLDKLGHKNCTQIQFDQFEFNGETPFSSIREPKSIVLAEGILR